MLAPSAVSRDGHTRSSAANEEILIGFDRIRVARASQFRATWLAGSLRALRSRGLFDRYLAHLTPDTRDTILSSIAGTWLPVEIAVEHYEACDRLELPREVQIDIGREVTAIAHGTVLDTTVKLAKGLGATPWTLLAQVDKLWKRVWVGGAVGLVKLGPKDARVEIAEWPCARVSYCRSAMHGVLLGIVELVSRRAYVHPVPGRADERSLAYRIAWA